MESTVLTTNYKWYCKCCL